MLYPPNGRRAFDILLLFFFWPTTSRVMFQGDGESARYVLVLCICYAIVAYTHAISSRINVHITRMYTVEFFFAVCMHMYNRNLHHILVCKRIRHRYGADVFE